MILTAASEEEVLNPTDAMNLSLPLKFTAQLSKSQLFGNASPALLKALETKPLTFNAHVNGMSVERFMDDKMLTRQFRVISTNFDRRGLEFISTYEGLFLINFLINSQSSLFAILKKTTNIDTSFFHLGLLPVSIPTAVIILA